MAKKSSSSDELNRAERIALALSSVNAHLNAGVKKSEWRSYVDKASNTVSPFKLRRPSGILALDIALGGGFPAGGICQIAGPDGVGKNALCHQTIAQLQRIYGEESTIAWACTEFALDKPFAQLFGVVVPMSDDEVELESMARKRDGRPLLTKDQLAEMQRSLGEFTIIETGTSAKRLEAVVELVKTNLYQLIVVDSVAALLTEARDEKQLDEEPQQSSEARLVTEFQKKLWGAYTPQNGVPNWTTLLIINQVRANRTQFGHAREWKVGGANALKHGKLGDVWLMKGEPITGKTDEEDEDGEEKKSKKRIGKKIRWEIAKGKAGFHEGPSGDVEYLYDSGFQMEKNAVDAAINCGVLRRRESKGGKSPVYDLVDSNGDVIESYVGKPAIFEAAYDDLWLKAVYDLVLRKEGVSCIYRL